MNHPQFILGCMMVFWPLMFLLIMAHAPKGTKTKETVIAATVLTAFGGLIAYGFLLAIRAL